MYNFDIFSSAIISSRIWYAVATLILRNVSVTHKFVKTYIYECTMLYESPRRYCIGD